MKMNEELKATGHVEILMNGKKVRDIKNLVVTVGKNWIASRLADAEAVMGYMAVGTDGSTAVVGQTALVTELKRNALTTPGGTVTDNTIQYACTFAAGEGTGALQEAGIFDLAAAGIMLARTRFEAINKGADDVMTIVWTLTIS